MFRTSSLGAGGASTYACALKYVTTNPNASSDNRSRATSPAASPMSRGVMPPPPPRTPLVATSFAPSWTSPSTERRGSASPVAVRKDSFDRAHPRAAPSSTTLAQFQPPTSARPPQPTSPSCELVRGLKAVTEEVMRLRAQADGMGKRTLDLECAAEAERAEKRARIAEAETAAAATAELQHALRSVQAQLQAQQAQIDQQRAQLGVAAAKVGDLEARLSEQQREAAAASHALGGDLFDLFLDDGESDEDEVARMRELDLDFENASPPNGRGKRNGGTELADEQYYANCPPPVQAHASRFSPLELASPKAHVPPVSPDRDFCRAPGMQGSSMLRCGGQEEDDAAEVEDDEEANVFGKRLAQLMGGTPDAPNKSQTDHSTRAPARPKRKSVRPPPASSGYGTRSAGRSSLTHADQPRSSAHDAAIAAANFGAACRRGLFKQNDQLAAENLFDAAMSA